MTTTSQRTKAILHASIETLRRHPRLMWFPVLSALGTMMLLLMVLTFSLGLDTVLGPEASIQRERIVGGLTVWYGITFVTTLCAVGLSRATLDAMAGRSWTLTDAMGHAVQRLGAVATFALIQAGITRMIQRMRRRPDGRRRGVGRRMTATILDFAWWGASYLAIPVLARESLGGLGSLSRSAELFKGTWKESFVGRLALGWLWLPFVLVVAIPAGLCALLEVRDQAIWMMAVGVPLMLCGAAALFVRTLDTIYRTALYVFATEGVVPEPFDDPDLHEVWHVK